MRVFTMRNFIHYQALYDKVSATTINNYIVSTRQLQEEYVQKPSPAMPRSTAVVGERSTAIAVLGEVKQKKPSFLLKNLTNKNILSIIEP